MMTRIKHLYIHVPFCKTICGYCDFCHRVYDENIADKWLDTLVLEINDKCKDNYETIYIGGGTPTSLSSKQLDRLLTLVDPYSKCVKEYTIEVNPESLDTEKIDIFKKHNINRVSMGVQSSNNNELKLMNRKHTFSDVEKSIKLLKDNGLNNISIDLMYSLPSQTMDTLSKTLEDFIKLDIPHVSLYSLTIEGNSIFAKKGYKPLDEDIEADMYELIVNTLSNNGYEQYEVSNFSKKGYESKHNIGYWQYDNFLGISLGASGKIDNYRYTNTRNFKKYFEDYNSKDEYIELSENDLIFENLMMSLRMKKGIYIKDFNNKYNIDFKKYFKKGLNNSNIEIVGEYCRAKNLAILNNTLIDFME